jgi:hypothetical protein
VSFEADYRWQDQFFEVVRTLIGPLNVDRAPRDEDTRQATDMMMLIQRDARVGCRIRRQQYAARYPWEFTIRSRRDTGAKTEFEKVVMEGFCDRIFYGFAAQPEPGPLSRWFYVNVAHFRGHLASPKHFQAIRWGEKSNGDGTYFYHYDVRSFLPEPPILIAQSHQWHGDPLPPLQVQGTRVAAKDSNRSSVGPLFDRR